MWMQRRHWQEGRLYFHVLWVQADYDTDGRPKYIGTFDTPQQARAAYIAEKAKLYPEAVLCQR